MKKNIKSQSMLTKYKSLYFLRSFFTMFFSIDNSMCMHYVYEMVSYMVR